MSTRAKSENKQMIGHMATAGALPGFNGLGRTVTPIFLLMDHFLYRFSTFSEKMNGNFLLWNNEAITIEKKMLFWKSWFDKNIFFIQDILSSDGNFLTFEEFQNKFRIKTNYLHYLKYLHMNSYFIQLWYPCHLKIHP